MAGGRRAAAVGALALCAATLLAAAGCRSRPPDVIVVLADTLRADRLGAGGGRPGLTPFLDELAASGVVFRNAYSPSSWTNPSIASLFTSRYPSQHHVARFDSRLADDEVTLAERLRPAGWRSLGWVGNFRLQEEFGYGQGFDYWATLVSPGPKVRAKRVIAGALGFYDEFYAASRRTRWLRRTRPMFLYLHFMEPHSPYLPPAHVRRRIAGPAPPGVDDLVANAKVVDPARWDELSDAEVARLRALYDAEVAELDRRLRRLFDLLAARGLLEHAIVVVTADHGEEFREHHDMLHGITLFQEGVRIPLVVAGPGVPAGRVVDAPVSLVDVAPTLLDLLGLPPEPRFEGRSLRELLAPEDEPREVVLQLLPTGAEVDVRRHRAGLVHAGRKVLVAPREDAGAGVVGFDLVADPGEQHPDPPDMSEETPALRARLAQRERALATRAGTAETAPVDPELRDRLRALGYAD